MFFDQGLVWLCGLADVCLPEIATIFDGRQRILAFGDSLTEGFIRHQSFHPYSARLAELLPQHDIINAGHSGELACAMPSRLEGLLVKDRFDWVIVLAGTNDFLQRADPERIQSCLRALWSVARFYGAKVLVMTIPEVELPAYYEVPYDVRITVNRWIRNSTILYDKFLDLDVAFPLNSLNETMKQRYWSDGVHPSAEGYDVMGELLSPFFQ